MGIFGSRKKGNEQLRTLSEKEIQDRLYGSFRMIHHTSRHEIERLEQHQEAKTSPAVALDVPFTPKVSPQVETTRRIPSIIDRRKEAERLAYVSEWADEEADTTAKAAKFGWLKQGKNVPSASTSRSMQPQKAAFVPLFKTFLAEIVQLFRVLTAPSRQVRRKASWMTLGFVVLSVFLGIHFLNLNREKAMKNSRRADISTPVAATEKMLGTATSMGDTSKNSASPLSPVFVDKKLPPSSQTTEIKKPEGRFVIQVCTYANEDDAKQLMARIQREEYPAFVKIMRHSSGKVYHLVFVGRFKDAGEAKRTLANFQKRDIGRPFNDAFVRTL